MTNQTNVSSDTGTMSEEAAVQSAGSAAGTVYALAGPWAPEYRKVIKIEMTPDGPQSTVVQDYKLVGELNTVMQDALAALQDKADDDDTPEQIQYLMGAWQALAMYLASCDDEDQAGAAIALKMVSSLMNGTPVGGPMPTGTFGRTTQTAAADAKPDPKKKAVKLGKNGKPLPPWLQPKDKASTTYDCAIDGRAFTSMSGLVNHLQVAHKMSAPAAKAKAAK